MAEGGNYRSAKHDNDEGRLQPCALIITSFRRACCQQWNTASPHTEAESAFKSVITYCLVFKRFKLWTWNSAHLFSKWTQNLVFLVILVWIRSIVHLWLWVFCFAWLVMAGAGGAWECPHHLWQSTQSVICVKCTWTALSWWTVKAVAKRRLKS